jgi:Cd2+/Zn2+-exporting ATPase
MGKGCAAHSSKKESDGHHSMLFDEFFERGQTANVSPFLTSSSRKWASNLPLKTSLLGALLLAIAFLFSFFPSYYSLSHLLLIVVYFLAGVPALIDSIEDLVDFDVNIDVLMTLAAFSSVLIGSAIEGALLLVLFDLAGSIENTVTNKTQGALHSLHKLAPNRANVLDEAGRLHERAICDISIGTTILVKAGEVVPLDGRVIGGGSFVNLVHLTGENKPFAKNIGDQVEAGGRTIEGSLTIQVTHTNTNSTLARIIKLINEAQEAKPKLQRWFDKLSRTYALSIIALSLGFALLLPFLLDLPFLGDEGSVYRALTFLIAASPCALIIALPTAYLSAISSCARKGILLKGGVTLDALAGCRIFAFDKTGTLTTGVLTVTSIESLAGKGLVPDLLAIAAALEQRAKHPIAEAITGYAKEKDILPAKVTNFEVIPGSGAKASVDWKGKSTTAYIGSRAYIQKKTALSLPEEASGTAAYLLVGDTINRFHFIDEIRPGVGETLKTLEGKYRCRVMMLTGDNQASADLVAEQLQIQEYQAGLQPDQKLKIISDLADQQGLTMVGDGINDAPSLARATIGISMGAFGSSTSIEASDIVLLHDNIEHLSWLVEKARKTGVIVRQNLFLAASVIIVTSIPALLGLVPLGLAVILHEGGTLLVGLNGLRLLRR